MALAAHQRIDLNGRETHPWRIDGCAPDGNGRGAWASSVDRRERDVSYARQYLQGDRSDRTAAVAQQPGGGRGSSDLDRNGRSCNVARRKQTSQPSDSDCLNHGWVQRAPAAAVEFRTDVAAADHADHGRQSAFPVPTNDVRQRVVERPAGIAQRTYGTGAGGEAAR